MLKTLFALPVYVERATTENALREAIAVRKAAYGRHHDGILERWSDEPNEDERALRLVVLVARSCASGRVVGTITLTDSRDAPLSFTGFVQLPSALQQMHLVGASRLAIETSDEGRVARAALWKAFWRYAVSQKAEAMVLAAIPALQRHYRMVLFEDVQPGGLEFEIPVLDSDPHRVMWAPMKGLAGRFFQLKGLRRRLPIIAFMLAPHPGIRLDAPDARHPSRLARAVALARRALGMQRQRAGEPA